MSSIIDVEPEDVKTVEGPCDSHEPIEEETERFANPFCVLQRHKSSLAIPCSLSLKECYLQNHETASCPHYHDELSEEARAIRDAEVERLEKKIQECEEKAKRYEKIKSILNNPKTSTYIGLFGCFGCLLAIAGFIASIAAGIYLVKLAWQFLVFAWGA